MNLDDQTEPILAVASRNLAMFLPVIRTGCYLTIAYEAAIYHPTYDDHTESPDRVLGNIKRETPLLLPDIGAFDDYPPIRAGTTLREFKRLIWEADGRIFEEIPRGRKR